MDDVPLPGPGVATSELRFVPHPTICKVCGKLAAPQNMRVHFASFWNEKQQKWLWKVTGYTHIHC